MIIIGATLVQAIIAGGLGTLAWWIVGRLGGTAWLALWAGLTIAIFIALAAPVIRLG